MYGHKKARQTPNRMEPPTPMSAATAATLRASQAYVDAGGTRVTRHVAHLLERDRTSSEQRTAEWFARRRQKVTASLIAAVVGKNRYESRAACLRKKVATTPERSGNEATAHGNKYEDEAIEHYERIYGTKVLRFGLMDSLNPDEQFLAGSPDGITQDGVLIEVKCPFRRTPVQGEVPEMYIYQVQCLMHILKLPTCHFIEYVPPSGLWSDEPIFYVTEVAYDPVSFIEILPDLRRFWEDVVELRERGYGDMLDQNVPDEMLDARLRLNRKRARTETALKTFRSGFESEMRRKERAANDAAKAKCTQTVDVEEDATESYAFFPDDVLPKFTP